MEVFGGKWLEGEAQKRKQSQNFLSSPVRFMRINIICVYVDDDQFGFLDPFDVACSKYFGFGFQQLQWTRGAWPLRFNELRLHQQRRKLSLWLIGKHIFRGGEGEEGEAEGESENVEEK